MKLNLVLFFLLPFAAAMQIEAQIAFDTVETTNVGTGSYLQKNHSTSSSMEYKYAWRLT